VSNGVDLTGHSTLAVVEKYDDDQVAWVESQTGILAPSGDVLRAHVKPYDVIVDDSPNLTTTNGLGRLTNFLIGTGSLVGFDSTHTMLGVGDANTAATAADTHLGSDSAAHSYYVATGAPTRVTTTVTNDSIQAAATFNTSNSDFAWQEWGFVLVTTPAASATFAGTGTSPILFNHKIQSFGTKSGGSWVLTATLTWS
jgi:hypothetical protein